MSPLKAIRKFCVQCAGAAGEVKTCGGDKMLGQGDPKGQCWFYPYRIGRGRPSVKTIRKHCLECMGGSRKLVAQCASFYCPVYCFRFGNNPNRLRKKDKTSAEAMV
jgi:hypothetical protein